MSDEAPVTPPEQDEPVVADVPTYVDHAIRWGMVLLGIVTASLGALYPATDAMPSWARGLMVVGGIVVSTFKGLGFNAIPMAKRAVGK